MEKKWIFHSKRKKKESVKMGYFETASQPTCLWLQRWCWWSRPSSAEDGGGGPLDPRPNRAADTLCDLEWVTAPPDWVFLPLARWAMPPSAVCRKDECLACACPRVRGLERQRVYICLSVFSPSTKDFELLWERGCVNAAQSEQTLLPQGAEGADGWVCHHCGDGAAGFPSGLCSVQALDRVKIIAGQGVRMHIHVLSWHLPHSFAKLDGRGLTSTWGDLEI